MRSVNEEPVGSFFVQGIGIFSSLMFQQSYKDTDSIYRNQQYK